MVKTYDEWVKDYNKLSDKQKKSYYDSANIMANKWNQDYQSVLKYIEQYNSGANTKSDVSTNTSTKTNATSPTTSTTNSTTNKTTPYVAPTANTSSWNYEDDSEERQMEIIRNLEDAYSKNPNNFSNWDTFANKFNYYYSERSDAQRAIMKDWYDKKFGANQSSNKTVVDSYFDSNNNQHISYSDGSSTIIPWWLTTNTSQWWQSWLSADRKTYTFREWYEPIYPEWEIQWDKSTNVANLKGFQMKSDAYDYQSDSSERYQEILDHLDSYYTTHPEYFTDRTSFDANFHIDQRSIGQQQVMVDRYYAKKKQERDYDAISGLNDGQSIYDAINGWKLTNDQLDLLKWTPQYDQYLSITKDKVNLATVNNDPSMFFVNSMPATLEELRDEIMATIGDMGDYNMWEYMLSLYDGEDYERVRDRVEKSTQEALLVKAEYDSIDSDVRWRLEWTGATRAYINAVIAREQNDLIPRVNTAYAQLQADQTNYNLWHQSVEDKYKSYYDQAHYEINKYNAQINAFQTMWGVYKDVAQYDWNYKQQVRLMELQDSYNNPMLDSEDIDEAKRALKQTLQAYYDTYWPIIKRDINKVMEDVLAYAEKNGVSLSTALQKNFVDQLIKKPEYKELQNQYLYGREYLYQKAWTASSKSSSSSGATPTWETPIGWSVTPSSTWWQQTADVTPSAVDYSETAFWLEEFIARNPDKTTWWQCGHFVNNYLNWLWFWANNIKDSIEDKSSLINDDVPTVWSILVMNSSKAPENWHVAIVRAYDPNTWIITVTDSNRDSDKVIKTHNIEIDKTDILWFINPSKAYAYRNWNGSMPNSEFIWDNGRVYKLNEYWYLDELTERYKYYNEHGEISSTLWWAEALKKSYWITDAEFSQQAENFKTYWPEAKTYLTEIQDLKSLVSWLLSGIDDLSRYNLYTWKWLAWQEDYDYLVNQITLSYYVDLKSKWATFGQMSNAEWDLISTASTQLKGYLDSFKDKMLFDNNKETIKNKLYDMLTRYERLEMNNPVYIHEYAKVWGKANTTWGSTWWANSWGSTWWTNWWGSTWWSNGWGVNDNFTSDR